MKNQRRQHWPTRSEPLSIYRKEMGYNEDKRRRGTSRAQHCAKQRQGKEGLMAPRAMEQDATGKAEDLNQNTRSEGSGEPRSAVVYTEEENDG